MADEIRVERLLLRSLIGITAAERAEPQRLTVSLTIEPVAGFRKLDDRIENAVDYAEVCGAIQTLASRGERHLLETLAEEIAALVLKTFAVRRVTLELRKYPLPETDFVAARISRSAPDGVGDR